MLVARVEFLGEVDARGAVRFRVDGASTVRGMDGAPFDAIVHDFSRTGFLFVADADLPIGSLVSIGLSGAGAREARVVRRDGPAHGCEFLVPLPQSAIEQAFRGQEEIVADLEVALARQTLDPVWRRLPPEPEPHPRPSAIERLWQRLRGDPPEE